MQITRCLKSKYQNPSWKLQQNKPTVVVSRLVLIFHFFQSIFPSQPPRFNHLGANQWIITQSLARQDALRWWFQTKRFPLKFSSFLTGLMSLSWAESVVFFHPHRDCTRLFVVCLRANIGWGNWGNTLIRRFSIVFILELRCLKAPREIEFWRFYHWSSSSWTILLHKTIFSYRHAQENGP